MLGFQLQHHAPIAEFYTVDLKKKNMVIQININVHPWKPTWLAGKPTMVDGISASHGRPHPWTPLNIHGERNLKNHPSFEKENHLNQSCILGVSILIFQGIT